MTSARAWAHCGDRQIAYARAGNGRTMVLLTTATLDDLTGAPASELARSFRLLRPELNELAGQPIVCASCISGFLEALGVDRAVIVADPKYASAVEQIDSVGADRVERVVVLPQPLIEAGIQPLFESLAALVVASGSSALSGGG